MALVGLGLPERLALGAAIGHPGLPDQIKSSPDCPASVTATVSSPPVVLSGTQAARGPMIVSGPGQNFSVKALI